MTAEAPVQRHVEACNVRDLERVVVDSLIRSFDAHEDESASWRKSGRERASR